MNFFKKISPEWALRLGIGVMYLYSGQDLIFSPTAWHWALPYWLRQAITSVVPIDSYLRIQGAAEIALALVLLAWFLGPKWIKWAALISTLEMAGILALAFIPWSETNFSITFRDIGLLGGSLALFCLLVEKEERATQPAVLQ